VTAEHSRVSAAGTEGGVTEVGVIARRDDGLEISTDPGRLDLDRITRWLADESYWAAGRPRDVVQRSVDGSLNLGVYGSGEYGSGADGRLQQVALARVVTDNATFAWICDVFVDEAWRGRGIGSWLMRECVTELLERRGIQRLLLATRDAHAVYAQAGFAPLEGVWRWMELDRRPARDAIIAMGPPDGAA
jgi:GNAT superfamily N-acetyltransferase